MYSTQDFPGRTPQRFHGGRVHLRPVDSIGSDFDTGKLDFRGRKHFVEGITPIYQPRPGIKIGFPKNVTNPEILFTYQSKAGPNKLTYMPPIKKTKEFNSKMPKLKLDKSAEEQHLENMRMIEELTLWEQKFLK